MRKTILIIGCLVFAQCFAAGGTVKAVAAVKESVISEKVLTDAGNINILDWDTIGAEEHFEPVITNYYAGSPSSGIASVYYGEALDLTEGSVVIEYDILSGETFSAFGPFIGTEIGTNRADFQCYGNSIQVSSSGTDWTAWTDEGMTEAYPAHFQLGFTYKAADDVSLKARYTFKADRSFGVETFGKKADGSLEKYNSMWLKDKTFADLCSGNVYFGVFYGLQNAAIDNLVFKQGDRTLVSVDFGDAGQIVSVAEATDPAVNTAGKICLDGPRQGESFIRLKNFSNEDRFVSALDVDGEGLEKAFELKGRIRFNALTKKFGLATGLARRDSAIDSYLYFYNDGDTTKIASTKTGETVDLGENLVGKTETTPFTVEGFGNGTVTVKILDKTATFTGFAVKGKLAFLSDGEGNVNVDIDQTLDIRTYSYRASEHGGIANNFNTGYLNPADWATQETLSSFLKNPADAKGLLTENKKLTFWGTADGTYFSSTYQYADYILEFDYTSPAPATRPDTNWTYGYGGLCVGIGANSYSGWVNSAMIILQSEYFQLQNWKSGTLTQTEAGTAYADGTFVHASEDADKTSAIKIVVMNGNIKIYMQDITSTEFKAENYILAAEFDVPDAYGYISFCANESSFFSLDNVRITPISDVSEEVMQETVNSFVDRQPIADEAAPVVLSAPVPALNGNVVSWTAVENAAGYRVSVNGKAGEIQTSTSYTIVEKEGVQVYEITVVAVGDGEDYLDSIASAKVTYTKATEKPDSSSGSAESKPSGNGCGGCGSSVISAGVLFVGALFVAGTALRLYKKKNGD